MARLGPRLRRRAFIGRRAGRGLRAVLRKCRPVRAEALRIGAHRGCYGFCVTGKPLRPLTSPVMTMLPSRAPVPPAYDCTA